MLPLTCMGELMRIHGRWRSEPIVLNSCRTSCPIYVDKLLTCIAESQYAFHLAVEALV